MDLRQMRIEAMNCYNSSPQQVKDLAHDFFRSMDTNGDGGVDIYEIQRFLQGRTFLSQVLNGSVFRELDGDGNGALDFDEFITLFFIVFMCFGCNVCGALLRGQRHLTCGTCFITSSNHNGDTYDICGSCYAGGYFRHHHGNFVDYYTLILDGSSGNASQGSNNSAAYAGGYIQSHSLNNRSGGSREIFGILFQVLQNASALSTIASAASTGSCTIM